MSVHPINEDMTQRLLKARLNSIDISELIGLCKGVIADGTVNLKEADFILHWLDEYRDVIDIWPADVLHKTLNKVLEDGTLDKEETEELIELLTEITGGPVSVLFY